MRPMFHVLIHPAINGLCQFETFHLPIDGIEPEQIVFGNQFDMQIYRMPGEHVSAFDFDVAMIVSAKRIVDTTGLKFLGGQVTLH